MRETLEHGVYNYSKESMITARLHIKSKASTMKTWVVVHGRRWWKGVMEELFQCHSRAENPRGGSNPGRGLPLARSSRPQLQQSLIGLVLRSVFHCDQKSVVPAVCPSGSFHSPDTRHHVFDGTAEAAYKVVPGYLEHNLHELWSRSCAVPLVVGNGRSAKHSREKMVWVGGGFP